MVNACFERVPPTSNTCNTLHIYLTIIVDGAKLGVHIVDFCVYDCPPINQFHHPFDLKLNAPSY